MWSLNTAKKNIIIAGCLGMCYTQLTLSAASIDYVRDLGGNALHIGILNAIPVALLGFQFLAALVANHLTYRRTLWMALSIVQRVVVGPVLIVPLIWPKQQDSFWIWVFLVAITLNQALLHFCSPLWLSWMGDYLPHHDLNAFWGRRHRWLQWAAAFSLLGAAMMMSHSGLEIRHSYPVLAVIAGVLGIADILIFLKVEEPPVTRHPQPSMKAVLLAPFQHDGFRSFIGFMCFWHFSAMMGAAFISLYLLDFIGMSLNAVLLLWMWSWVGGASASSWLGQLGDRFGNKPLLVLCVVFKSINMIALLSVPRNPTLAFYILVPVFMADAILNAGFAIATNGFLLKNSPTENRTMFIASGTALAGMVGGVTAIAAGAVLTQLDGWSTEFLGREFGPFHIFFAASLGLRLISVAIVSRIREPSSHSTIHVVTALIGVTPLRVMRYPVGLYRSVFDALKDQQSKAERSEAIMPTSVDVDVSESER